MEPLFRWAGSKRKLLSNIRARFPTDYGTYHEPFCGSACLFFDVLPKAATLADMNHDLISAYQSIKDSPIEVAEALARLEVTKDNYYYVRSLLPENLTLSDRAARFIFLNRLCFNAVYRTNKLGHFNVPMGTKTGKMPGLTAILDISQALMGANLMCADFTDSLSSVSANDLVYLDPPYSKPGSRSRGEYGPDSFHYNDIDRLVGLLTHLDSIGANFILSYSDCEVIRSALKDDWQIESISVRRHVAGFSSHRKIVDALIVTNYRD